MTPLCNSWYTQNIAFMCNENIYMAVPGFNSAAVFWVRNSELTPSENSFPDIPLDSATRVSVNRTVLYKPLVPWHFAVRTSLGTLGYNTSNTLLRTICEAGEFMLTPWKGIAFRITGPLRGEPPVTGGFSSPRVSNTKLWCVCLVVSLKSCWTRIRWVRDLWQHDAHMTLLYCKCIDFVKGRCR